MPSFDHFFDQSTFALSSSPFTHPFRRQSSKSPRVLPVSSTAGPFTTKSAPMLPWAQTSQFQTTQAVYTNKSRKRSRDDAAANLADDSSSFHPSPMLAPEVEDEWQYGEGMVLIKPNRNGCCIDAASSTGTWAEERAAEEQAEKVRQQQTQTQPDRANARNKLQRLDHSAIPVLVEEAMPSSSTSVASSPPKSSIEPTVDDFTMYLGIGWKRISEDEHIQAAARGWAKFIENNYPVTCPVIQLESRGLNSYLVAANEGFFLFGEDLKQGRLVSTDLVKAVQNLQVNPPLFDGSEVLVARSEEAQTHQQRAVDRKSTDVSDHCQEGPSSVDIDMDMN